MEFRILTGRTRLEIVFLAWLLWPLACPAQSDRQAADSLFAIEQYQAAAERYEQILEALPDSTGPRLRIELLLRLSDTSFRQGDYRRARAYCERALEMAGRSGDAALLADGRYRYGRVLTRLSEYERGEAELQAAIDGYRVLGRERSPAAADALASLGYLYLLNSRLEECEAMQREALAIRQAALGDDHLDVAASYNGLGNLYLERGDFERARDAYQRCLDIRERQLTGPHILLGNLFYNLARLEARRGRTKEAMAYNQAVLDTYRALDPDHVRTGDAYLLMGQLYVDIGDYPAGRDCFLETLRIFRRAFGERQERVGTAYNLLSNISRLSGDYEEARRYAERGLDVTRAAVGPDHDRVASGLTSIGDIEANAGNYPAALAAYREALDIRRRAIGEAHPRTAFLYYMLGITYQEAGRAAEGLPLLERAVAIYRRFGLEGTEDITNVYAALGLVYTDLGRFALAGEYLRRDVAILRELYGDNHPYLGDSYDNLARWHHRQGDVDSTLVYLHEAMRAMSLDFDDPDLYAAPTLSSLLSPYEFLDLLQQKGDAFMERAAGPADRAAALACYHRAAELIDGLRSQYRSQRAKLFFQEEAAPVYAAGLRTAYLLYRETGKAEHLADAFRFAERGKAGLLTAAVQGVEERAFATVPDTLRAQARSLRARINGAEQLVMDERLWPSDSTGATRRRLRAEQVALQSSYDSLLAVVQRDYPQFYHLSYGTQIVEPEALQERLAREGATLFEYFLSDSLLYIFTIRPAGMDLEAVAWTGELRDAIDRLRQPPGPEWLTGTAAATQAYLSAAARLYEVLIGDRLTAEDPDRLIVVPHGELAYLPFEVLSAGPAAAFREAPLLLRRCAIQYAHSATLWSDAWSQVAEGGRELLGIAPTYDEPLAVAAEFRGRLAPLRFNTEEVTHAAARFPGRLLTGAAATERAFKALSGDRRILHLAMHALISDSLPMQSHLLFAPPADTLEDGRLHTYELYNLHLSAELAVLSACNSGFGPLQGGEGAMSLAHAFRYAGCRSVVVSLWPAEDESTAGIIDRFYDALAEGLPKDEALRRARLAYLDDADPLRAHPHYWTHLLAIGDMAPLRPSATDWGWWLGAGGFLAAMLAGLALNRRRKTRKDTTP